MQLSDIRTRVRERLGLSTSDTAITDAILTQFINTANRKIALMHDWPWLIKTDATWTALTVGQSDYVTSTDVATDVRKTLYLIVDTDYQLVYKQPQDLARYAAYTSGHPAWYTIEGTTFRIAPAPDTAYDVRHVYVAEVATLTNDTDIPEMGATNDEWAIDYLIDYTCLLVAIRLRDAELVKYAKDEWARSDAYLRDEISRTRQLPKVQHRRDIGWT